MIRKILSLNSVFSFMKKIFQSLILVTLFFNSCFSLSEKPESSIVQSQSSSDFVVFTGNSNPELAKKIADELKINLGKIKVGRFNDQEIRVQCEESLRGKHVYIVQSTCTTKSGTVNDFYMELLLMIDAARLSSAASITVVIPYYGYARQDRRTDNRSSISAALVSRMLKESGANQVVCVDLHSDQTQGFFDGIPVDNLYASLVFAPYIKELKLEAPVIVSPDAGGVTRAERLQNCLKKLGVETSFAMISKKRAGAGVIDSMDLIGDVNGKDAIIVDDMCDTGGTLVKAAEELKKKGAKEIYVCVTHPVFSKNALQTIANSPFKHVIVTDSIPVAGDANGKIKVLSLAPMLAEVIKRIHTGNSVSALFQ